MGKVKVIIGHHPELTAESAMKIFESQLADKYELYMTRIPRIDFIVKQSAWRGVSVSLRRKRGQTYFQFSGMTPSPALMIMSWLFGVTLLGWGLLAIAKTGGAGAFIGFLLWIALVAWVYSLVFSRPSRRIVKEIKAFIEQEFKEDLQKFESKNNT